MQQAEAFPQRLEQAEIRRFHAMTLMDRAARDGREKARSLLNEAARKLHPYRNAPPHRDGPNSLFVVITLNQDLLRARSARSLEISDQTGSLRPIGDEE